MAKAILIVDPYEDDRALFALILREEGYEVAAAASREEVAALLAEVQFDLIITEAFEQPDCFRFDPAFLAALRSVADDTPIVLSSICPSAQTLRASRYDLVAVLPKPFTVEELLEKVSGLLG